MRLDAARLAAFASDVAWAFGLKDAKGAALAFEAPRNDKGARAILTHLRGALTTVRPVARAPSVGEILDALGAPRATTKARRRALAELVELVAQGTHHRAKRQERGRILAELVLLFDLEGALDLTVDGDPERAAAAIPDAIDALLER